MGSTRAHAPRASSTRRSAGFFEAVVEKAIDGIILVRGDGAILYENEAMARMLGRRAADRLGQNAFEFVHPDDLPVASDLFSALARNPGGSESRIIRVLDSAGSWRWVEVVGRNSLEEPRLQAIVANLRDIGDFVREREQAAATEAIYRIVFENSAVAITVTDKNERIISWNHFAEQVLRMGRDELLNRPVRSLYPVAEWRRLRARNVRQKGMQHHIETKMLTGDGQEIDVALSVSVLKGQDGSITGSIGVISDIGELKRAEEALRRREDYYRSLLENALDATMILNEDGSIRYQSPSIRHITGYEPGEREGASVFDLISPGDIHRAYEEFGGLLRNDISDIHTEFTLKHKDGTWHTIEAVGRNLLDNPSIAGIVANFRDITERKRAERVVRLQRDLAVALSGTCSLQEGLKLCLKTAIEISDMDCGGICILDTNTGALQLECHQGLSESFITAASSFASDSRNTRLVMEGRPVYTRYDDMGIDHSKEEILEGLQALAIIPVLDEGAVVASLNIASHALFEVPGVSRDAIEAVAAQMGSSIARLTAEKARRESEDRLSRLLEDMNDGYCVLRGSRILFANERIAIMFGHDRGDVVGRSVVELLPSQALVDLSEVRLRRRRGENLPRQYETILTTSDGDPIPVELSTRRIEYAGQPALSVVVRDVSERKRAEEALRRSEQQFRSMIENSMDGIAVLRQDASVRYLSPSTRRALGYRTTSLTDTVAFELIHPDDRPLVYEEFAGMIRKPGSTIDLNVRVIRADRSWAHIEATACNLLHDEAVEGIVVNFRDVTDRQFAEQALRESEEKYRGFVELASDGIAIVQDAIIQYVNQRSLDILGYRPEEMIGMPMVDFVRPEEATMALDRYQRRMSGEDIEPVYETVFVHRDGWDVPVEVAARQVNYAGRPADLIVVRDITERKRAEAEKARMEQQLQLSGRLAAVGQLAAGVAHELNNPLAAVQGFAQLIASRNDLDDTIKDDVETIFREAQRAGRITGNLLSFARKHRIEKRMISLNEVIEKGLELNEYRLRVNNIEVCLDLQPDLPETMADFHQLQQVFINIITNAEQAMSQGHGGGRLTVSSKAEDGRIQVTISDDGPGIGSDESARIFDPFYTTKEVGKGTGLGLSICFGILQEHGGRIWVSSEPDAGATFVVEMPVVAEQAETADCEPIHQPD